MKPTVLAKNILGDQFSLEIDISDDKGIPKAMVQVRNAISSHALSDIFVLVAKGISNPKEIADQTGKSKFVISLQLSKLKEAGLLERLMDTSDLRRKTYSVIWDHIAEIFYQDHAFEIEIYENHLLLHNVGEFRGSIAKSELVVDGNGRLGLVRHIDLDRLAISEKKIEDVEQHINRLVWEFVELFKAYLTERRFSTIREYLQGAYKELSDSYGRLPRNSELARFYGFMNRTFYRLSPVETLLKRHLPKRLSYAKLHKVGSEELKLKLFVEAGSSDHAGRYLLNPESRALIGPGMKVRIYPSYTY